MLQFQKEYPLVQGSQRLPATMAALKLSWAVISPAEARAVLETLNDGNRKMSRSNWRRLRDAMKEHAWEVNGATIVFDEEDRLLDGQHRLTACMESGQSFITLVLRNLPRERIFTIDVASTRTAAHSLQILGGVPYATLASPAIKVLAMLMEGRRTMKLTNQKVVHWIGLYPEIGELCGEWKKAAMASSMPITASVSAVVTLIGRTPHVDALPDFKKGLYEGVALMGRNDPVHRLRRYLIDHKVKRLRGNKLEQCACVIKAWTEYISEEDRTSNFPSPASPSKPLWMTDPDHFPEIPGLDYGA